MSYLSNNSKSVLVRVIHASSCNNPQMSLASTIKVYFLLMQSLMSWAGISSPSHYLGLQVACILQLHHLRAAALLWKAPINRPRQGFLGGSGVENLPAHAGDRGSIPGLGRPHVPQNSYSHAPQLLSLCLEPRNCICWAHVLQLLKPMHPRALASQ